MRILEFNWKGFRIYYEGLVIRECCCPYLSHWRHYPIEGVIGIELWFEFDGEIRKTYYSSADVYFRYVNSNGNVVIGYTNKDLDQNRYPNAEIKLGKWVPLGEVLSVDRWLASNETSCPEACNG